MNGSVDLLNKMHNALSELPVQGSNVTAGVFTPFIFVQHAAEIFKASPIVVGAQDCHWMSSGAFTGEISPTMLIEIGATHVILGHSEIRRDQGDSDSRIGEKAAAALNAGLTPIICVGESLAERNSDSTIRIVTQQLDEIIKASTKPLTNSVLAYEPIWAIGTGLAATPDQVQEVHSAIKEHLFDNHNLQLLVLYGGSVTAANAGEIFACPSVDGALVGGASLKPTEFSGIVLSAISAAQR